MADLEHHAKDRLLSQYQEVRPTLDALSSAVDSVLTRIVPSRFTVALSHRVKKFDSFFEKANKSRDGAIRYTEPFTQITDLVGFRVVVIAKRNVDQVCQIIRDNFNLVEEENKAEKLLEEGKLGYESHHLIMTLGDTRKSLGEYDGICDTAFEIQIRTALQHAWAENEHRIQYKATRKDPELRKRFLRLAGVVSSADEEFDRIYEINEKILAEVESGLADLPADDPIEASDGQEEKPFESMSAKLHAAATMFGVGALDLVRQRRYSEAIQVYDRFIALQPTQASHFAGRARARALDGDIDGALEDLTKSDELAPDNPAVKNVLRILASIAPDLDEQSLDPPAS